MSPTPAGGYYLKGRRVPSVSTILGNLGWGNENLMRWAANLGLEGIDYAEQRQASADRGTVAHELIDAHLHRRKPNLTGFDTDLIEQAGPCFRAYQAWARSNRVEVIASEFPLVSSALAYGGTPDALVRINRSETVLLDFKSSKWLMPKHVIQVVAYLDLIAECRELYLDRAIVLRVGTDGEFRALTVEGETITQAREAFYHLLQLHKLKYPLEKLTKSVNKPGAVPTSATLTIMGEVLA